MVTGAIPTDDPTAPIAAKPVYELSTSAEEFAGPADEYVTPVLRPQHEVAAPAPEYASSASKSIVDVADKAANTAATAFHPANSSRTGASGLPTVFTTTFFATFLATFLTTTFHATNRRIEKTFED
jgi:hypothetical protein